MAGGLLEDDSPESRLVDRQRELPDVFGLVPGIPIEDKGEMGDGSGAISAGSLVLVSWLMTFVATIETVLVLFSSSGSFEAPCMRSSSLSTIDKNLCLRISRSAMEEALSVESRFRFPMDETVVSTGVSRARGIEIFLIRPLVNSSVFCVECRIDTTDHMDLTFSAIIKSQVPKRFPAQFTHLCRMRGGFTDHRSTTGKPTKWLSAVNIPRENRDILHTEFPERAIHTDWQLQIFH
jgi:hypothetical protein